MSNFSRFLNADSGAYKKRQDDKRAIEREKNLMRQKAGHIVLCHDFFVSAVAPAVESHKSFRQVFGEAANRIDDRFDSVVPILNAYRLMLPHGALTEEAQKRTKESFSTLIDRLLFLKKHKMLFPESLIQELFKSGMLPDPDKEDSLRIICDAFYNHDDKEKILELLLKEIKFGVIDLGSAEFLMRQAGHSFILDGLVRYNVLSDLHDELPEQLDFWKAVNHLEDYSRLFKNKTMPPRFPPDKMKGKNKLSDWLPGWIAGVPKPT